MSAPPDTDRLFCYYNAGLGTYTDGAGTTPAVSDGDTVSLWKDQSLCLNDLRAGTAPILKLAQVNGLSAIRFNGSTQYLKFSHAILPAVRTMYAVLKIPTTGVYTIVCGDGHSLQWRMDTLKQRFVEAAIADIGFSTTGISAATWAQVNASWDGSAGVLSAFRSAQAADGTVSASDYTAAATCFYMGANAGTSEFFQTDIAALLQYYGVHTLAERQAVEAWIAGIWGV